MASNNPSQLPFVSIIIPVYNDSARLRICLEKLEEQTYPTELYEVIVVNNASIEPVEPAVTGFERVKLVFESQPGPDAARNTGLEHARGQYFAFTDSDCLPYPDWLMNGITKLLEHPQAGLVGGRVDVFPQDPENITLVELYESVFAFPTQLNMTRDHFMPTCNMFTTQAVFDKVGIFDPDLKTPGDEEWGKRVHAHGYPLVYDEKIAIQHPARRTFKSLHKKIKRITFRYVGLLRDKGDRPVLLQFKFWKRMFPLPAPYEWRMIGKSDLNLADKARVTFTVVIIRVMRGYEMFHALLPGQSRLW